MPAAAVFLDRDGVLIEDRNLLTRAEDICVLAGVPQALGSLKQAGFRLIVVSNQSVVARGLLTEPQLATLHAELLRLLQRAGAPKLDAIYVCPHHPEATVPAYRVECECRKPRPGSLHRAAREHGLDLARSFMVGDRITDIITGVRAGCRTVLITSGMQTAPPIATLEPIDCSVRPDYTCADLPAAAEWILQAR
jgi:D-glycero-D-manno-heptose 1,7-bisphosphate phosphatase